MEGPLERPTSKFPHNCKLSNNSQGLQTCKVIHGVSRSRIVWLSVLERHVASLPRAPRFEEPLEAYSSEELETMALNLISADNEWTSENPRPLKKYMLKDVSLSNVRLVQGGRWLLRKSLTGVVSVFDLSTHETPSKELIEPTCDPDAQAVKYIDIDYDDEVKLLTFNVALLPLDHDGMYSLLTCFPVC